MQDELYNQSVKDWWGIVSFIPCLWLGSDVRLTLEPCSLPILGSSTFQLSQVQWVQVIPLDTESLLSTDSQSI
jgi:hypothetical protein